MVRLCIFTPIVIYADFCQISHISFPLFPKIKPTLVLRILYIIIISFNYKIVYEVEIIVISSILLVMNKIRQVPNLPKTSWMVNVGAMIETLVFSCCPLLPPWQGWLKFFSPVMTLEAVFLMRLSSCKCTSWFQSHKPNSVSGSFYTAWLTHKN